jgi:hypothetical protein
MNSSANKESRDSAYNFKRQGTNVSGKSGEDFN